MTEHAKDFERYFRDPKVGEGVLAIGSSGLACKNIRLALRFLDFHDGIEFVETYDATLARDVLRFQEAHKHSSRDGQFGPGTRSLLTRILLQFCATLDESGRAEFTSVSSIWVGLSLVVRSMGQT